MSLVSLQILFLAILISKKSLSRKKFDEKLTVLSRKVSARHLIVETTSAKIKVIFSPTRLIVSGGVFEPPAFTGKFKIEFPRVLTSLSV